jgi:hypothetical protein
MIFYDQIQAPLNIKVLTKMISLKFVYGKDKFGTSRFPFHPSSFKHPTYIRNSTNNEDSNHVILSTF